MSAMRGPYQSDEHAAIYHGDARQALAEMPVDCFVTSPPYWRQRHYCDGQHGQEAIRPLRATLFAAFTIDIPLRVIAIGCCSGGSELDPFTGSGATRIAARQLGCKFSGIELNADYRDLARDRIANRSQGV